MKKYLIAASLLLLATAARAAPLSQPCYADPANPGACIGDTVATPLPVTITGGAGGTVTANQGAPNVGGATNAWPVQGAGTAGTPAGGVVSVQGVTSGTTIPVTAAQATAASLNATVVGTGTFTVQTTGNVGGYEFNASVIPTVQNASYTAGMSLGGLQTISIGSTNSLSGILTQIQVASKGGSGTAIVAYVWSKSPAATTCTDKTNFVVSQVDNEALVVQPQMLIPGVIVSGQDTITYATSTNLVGNFVNGSANTDLYVCLLTNATVTPATVSDLRLNIQGTKDAP
jgi:hypothetical protein